MIVDKISGLESIYTGLIIIGIFLWIISILRVSKDISARTNNNLLQIVCILIVTIFTPIIGLPLYHIIKPIGYKKDKIPRREACINNMIKCQNCQTLNPKEYKCCISCGNKLTTVCKQCQENYPHYYHYCPKCGAPNININ
ncbi:MAG TPA: hypothetical protein P5060_03440 [Candidatus Absconditabacterales bacterium]|nr:hypothetical protein [Candidatus Absconditabacterales bacterium]